MNRDNYRERQQREVDQNYEAFRKMLPYLLKQHPRKYALMRDKKVIGVFETSNDSYEAARLLYEDGIFSVQKIDDRPIDLGWMGYALFHSSH